MNVAKITDDLIPPEYREWYDSLHPNEQASMIAEIVKDIEIIEAWPKQYTSSVTGAIYEPHNDEEKQFVYNDFPRYGLLKGGEGAGKSVAGIIKDFERVRRGMHIIVLSPDLPHFKKSLWPVILEWCPWDCVIKRHRDLYLSPGWTPSGMFEIWFHSQNFKYARMICGGISEADVGAWEGPNVSACHFDEARRHVSPRALKVLDGRARIPGPNKEPPQLYLTTTPRKHWLFTYFGPIVPKDEFANFKRQAFVATVKTSENEKNLSPDFHINRANSLTTSEARIHLEAEWEDEEDIEKFVEIIWWDNCQQNLPPLTKKEPAILSLDASKGGVTTLPDTFALILVTRHPNDKELVAVRYSKIFLPQENQQLDFTGPKDEIKRLCRNFNIIEVTYDPYQLHDTCQTMKKEGIANFREFPQGRKIEYADKNLQRMIVERGIFHNGDKTLREHIDNSDCRVYKHDSNKRDALRIIKRNESQKIDLAKALSPAVSRCLYYNL